MAKPYLNPSYRNMPTFLLAGLAGGMAEVLFIFGYSQVTPIELGHVAREITASFSHELAEASVSPAIGLGIHFLLSLLIGACFSLALGRLRAWHEAPSIRFGMSIFALLMIWCVNFFILLPSINPIFVSILPLSVTFASKALFGLAMWATLEYGRAYSAYKRKQLASAGVLHEQFEQATA